MCGFTVYTGSDPLMRLSIAHEFQKIRYRGPDNTIMRDFNQQGWMGFHRLKIVDTSDRGNQPLSDGNLHLVCNGEVYNYPQLRATYESRYNFQSDSDCEVILPMYRELGLMETARQLDV